MTALSVRVQLALGFLGVLFAATLTIAGGAWWLFKTSTVRAADAALAARVEGTQRFIEATERERPPEELLDEFREFADLTSGETLLEVSDETGRSLCRPLVAGWDSAQWPAFSSGAPRPTDQQIVGQPFRAIVTALAVSGHRYRIAAAIPMSTQHAAMTRFGWLLGALVPVVMLVAALAGIRLSSRALAPVDRMTRDARLISLHRLDRRLDVPPADDELRRLALTFNDLLQRLQGAFKDMVQFTAEASHELRTPVSLARTTAEVTLARPRTADDYRDALGDVLSQTERMSKLVDDLLILARADAGIDASEHDDVDLRDAIDEALRDVAPLSSRRHVQVIPPAPDRALRVRGSAESLRRLLVIVLDNALKYTPSGGTVTLHASSSEQSIERDRHAILEILDSGPGIRDVDRARVFDRFYRGADARQAVADGSGLGLSIARTIVERHSGQILLSNGPNGRGCHVRVTLPLAPRSTTS